MIKVGLFLLYLNSRSKGNTIENEKQSSDREIDYDILTNKLVNPSKLEECKAEYPFAKWRFNATEYGMEQYSQENCEDIEMLFDELIAYLKTLPEDATAEDKVLLFKYAILATNAMDEKVSSKAENVKNFAN